MKQYLWHCISYPVKEERISDEKLILKIQKKSESKKFPHFEISFLKLYFKLYQLKSTIYITEFLLYLHKYPPNHQSEANFEAHTPLLDRQNPYYREFHPMRGHLMRGLPVLVNPIFLLDNKDDKILTQTSHGYHLFWGRLRES